MPPLLPGPDWENDALSLVEYGAAIALVGAWLWYVLRNAHRDRH